MHYFDPNPDDAWWPRTATLDWCEHNFAITYLIAEFWNATTNLVFVYLASTGYLSAKHWQLPKRFQLAFLLLGLIGSGSFLFHATLSYSAQLLDELPMIYCVCVLTYSIFQADVAHSRWDMWLRWALVSDAIVITLAYVWVKHPTFHQVAFGLHCVAILIRGSYRVQSLPNTYGRKQLVRLLAFSWGIQLLGFACWNFDNLACHYLRGWRQALIHQYGSILGTALAATLEMHGWWHILTGLGTYAYVVANAWMDILREDLECDWQLTWKFGLVPIVQPRSLVPHRKFD